LEAQRPSNVLIHQLHPLLSLFWAAAAVADEHTQAPGIWQVAGPHEKVSTNVCHCNVSAPTPLCVLHPAHASELDVVKSSSFGNTQYLSMADSFLLVCQFVGNNRTEHALTFAALLAVKPSDSALPNRVLSHTWHVVTHMSHTWQHDTQLRHPSAALAVSSEAL
jgi:hypothetical protein